MSTTSKIVKSKKCHKVTFDITAEAAQGAKKICLLCDFNGWDPIEMTAKKNGAFQVAIEIPQADAKNVYQYRFQYTMDDDSEMFENDWNAEKYVANPFGGENSVFTLDI